MEVETVYLAVLMLCVVSFQIREDGGFRGNNGGG